MEQNLTIGMAHHNDFSGAYFSIQDIRKELLFNRRYDLLHKIEFLIVENDHKSEHAKSLVNLQHHANNIRIVQLNDVQGTSATRNKIIEEAKTNFVLVMDCHVLLCPVVDTLDRLFHFLEYNKNSKDLFTGPLIHDNFSTISTHYNDSWGAQMWGQWGTAWECVCESYKFSIINDTSTCKFVSLEGQDHIEKCGYCDRKFPEKLGYSGHERPLKEEGYERIGINTLAEPFPIFAQGLGCFLTHKNSWLKFNEHARGFGGEECYIHEKYRQNGRKTYNLPFLRWLHRFGRPEGVKYELSIDNKVRNYILEFTEIDLDMAPLKKHFVDENNFSLDKFNSLLAEAQSIYGKSNQTVYNLPDEAIMKQIEMLQSRLSRSPTKKGGCCGNKKKQSHRASAQIGDSN